MPSKIILMGKTHIKLGIL